jgi:hypothetical protein
MKISKSIAATDAKSFRTSCPPDRDHPTLRHGGGQPRLDIQELEIAVATEDDQLLAVSEAMASG